MLINLRNALMAGKRLPYDAEVEYLQSTGTQYIDTGKPIPADFWFDATFDVTGTNNAYKTILGCRIGSGTNDYQFSFQASANYFLARYGTNSNQYNATTPMGTTHIRVASGGKLYVNGVYVKQLGVGSPSSLNMFIFALNNNGAVSQKASFIRLRSLKYGGANEEHDFIPVRKGAVGYLYDRVSGKLFGNDGTGDFVLGPDVVPVEWLQTDGSAYINTGLLTSSATNYDIRFSVSSFASGSFVYGTWNDSNHRQNLFIQNNRLAYTSNGGANVAMGALAVDTAIDASQRSGVLTVYGNSHTFTDSTTFTNPFYLLATNRGNNTTAAISGTRLYSCKLWNNSTLERNLLPIRVGTDATSWEGAMMDVLTRRIYRNAGTGAFGYGNDLKYPIPAE